jgi:hypothetical protein
MDELRRGVAGEHRMEVITSGTDAATLQRYFPQEEYQFTQTPSGLRIEVPAEEDVDTVLAALRQAGGKLVAVQPLRQSLEELFLDDQKDASVVSVN